jgi:membrane dipeptidase
VFLGQGPRDSVGNAKAKLRADEIFDSVYSNLDRNATLAKLAYSPAEALEIEKEGKRAVFLGIENGYPIGNDLAFVEHFYDRGARYITLCHTKNNDICDSSTDSTEYNGLSSFGEDVVKEMNRIGMMIDVSHISDSSFYDVIALSKAPVIASHSSARAICDHPRNLTDEMLLELAKNGGVAQVCILSDYVKKMPPNPERDSARAALREKYRGFDDLTDEEMKSARNEWREINKKYPSNLATVKDAVDHIDHIVAVAGIDHVGIGTDFDGGGGLADCFDVSEMPNITIELVRRGYTEEHIRQIWGGNIMRVMKQVQSSKFGVKVKS